MSNRTGVALQIPHGRLLLTPSRQANRHQEDVRHRGASVGTLADADATLRHVAVLLQQRQNSAVETVGVQLVEVHVVDAEKIAISIKCSDSGKLYLTIFGNGIAGFCLYSSSGINKVSPTIRGRIQ